jgi:hypothetical protein
MDHAPPLRTGRTAMRGAAFLASSALVAVTLSAALRALLPYENLRRYTPEARFFLWEGAVWMFGLVLMFWGAAAVLETLRLGRMEGTVDGALEGLRPRPFRASPVPWWMMSTGAVLVALAIVARAGLPG